MILDPGFELFPDAMLLIGYIGGTMIGVVAAIMLLGLGRIAGVSELLAGAMGIAGCGVQRRVARAFIIGLPLGALAFHCFHAFRYAARTNCYRMEIEMIPASKREMKPGSLA